MLKNKYIEIDFSRDSTNTRLLVPDKNEQIDDIVVGFKTLQEIDDFSHSTASNTNKITKNGQEITVNNSHGNYLIFKCIKSIKMF